MNRLAKLTIIALSGATVIAALSGAWWIAGWLLSCTACIILGCMISVSPEEEKMYTDAVNFKKIPKVPTRIDEGCPFDEPLPEIDRNKLMRGTDYWDEELIINNHF